MTFPTTRCGTCNPWCYLLHTSFPRSVSSSRMATITASDRACRYPWLVPACPIDGTPHVHTFNRLARAEALSPRSCQRLVRALQLMSLVKRSAYPTSCPSHVVTQPLPSRRSHRQSHPDLSSLLHSCFPASSPAGLALLPVSALATVAASKLSRPPLIASTGTRGATSLCPPRKGVFVRQRRANETKTP